MAFRVSWPWLAVTAGDLIALVAILGASIGLVEYICKNSFDENLGKRKVIPVLLVLLVAGLVAGSVLLREVVLFHIHTLLALGLMAVLYGIHKAVEEKVG